MPIVPCPRCRADLDIDAADLGHAVECPLCRSAFSAPAAAPLPRYDDARDRDDDDYDRPPPDSRRQERDRRAAENWVHRPANAMVWAAIIGIVLSLLVGGGLAAFGLSQLNGGNAKQADGVVALMYGVMILGFGLAVHIPMLVGAHRVKRLDGTGWGTASAILGIASVAVCTACPVSWFTAGFGIWLLVGMNKPETARAIRRNKRDREAGRPTPAPDWQADDGRDRSGDRW